MAGGAGTRERRAVLWLLCGAHAQPFLASAGLRVSREGERARARGAPGANGVFQSSPVEVWTLQLRMFTHTCTFNRTFHKRAT